MKLRYFAFVAILAMLTNVTLAITAQAQMASRPRKTAPAKAEPAPKPPEADEKPNPQAPTKPKETPPTVTPKPAAATTPANQPTISWLDERLEPNNRNSRVTVRYGLLRAFQIAGEQSMLPIRTERLNQKLNWIVYGLGVETLLFVAFGLLLWNRANQIMHYVTQTTSGRLEPSQELLKALKNFEGVELRLVQLVTQFETMELPQAFKDELRQCLHQINTAELPLKVTATVHQLQHAKIPEGLQQTLDRLEHLLKRAEVLLEQLKLQKTSVTLPQTAEPDFDIGDLGPATPPAPEPSLDLDLDLDLDNRARNPGAHKKDD